MGAPELSVILPAFNEEESLPQVWAEVALQAGYCDQAHFNRDFRAFSGRRPRELMRDLGPLTAFFLSAASSSDSSKTAGVQAT